MKHIFLPICLLVLALALVGCGSTMISEETPQADDLGVDSSTTLSPTQTEPTAATEQPTATVEIPTDVFQVGDLALVPFAPPWFDGVLSDAVFGENGLLRIDAPIAPYELDNNHVMGAVTVDAYDRFDISATFDAEGGACGGIDYCGNTGAFNCIVFDFVDFDNMQEFCIASSALFWTLVAFENGVVVYHSSVQPSDAIHDTGDIYRDKHPIPNEMRLTLQDGIFSGYINGEQMFERDSTRTEGKVGVGCINNDIEQALSNCEVTVVLTP